ncbi:MAG: PD-(D/E)XK nuclease family protein, partial [Porphyromonadaceae bacterium]|nr:PD-(D/E)XK nuclease family protein [Porphyromonadaceae bacterium]
MKPFLYQVAETFYREYGREIEHIAFVFPNRRAGAFFKKYLIGIIDTPLFSPTVTTVSDLFAQLSKEKLADHIYLLFTLYRHYIELSSDKESFDEFLPLGETLLNDFDDVDKYMVDARQLFTNIHDLKEIDSRFGSPLTEEQLSYIRRFWKSFVPIGESDNKSRFMALWEILFDLYTSFRNDLSERGLAYEGMMFREVAERVDVGREMPYSKVVFVGLNVLNRAEETLMKALQKRGIADFYWDDAAPTLKDTYNKASYFLRTNTRIFPSQLKLKGGEEEYLLPEVRVMGIPSAVGQTKQSGVILQELLQDKSLSADPDKALNTAIVLPDEHLLIPMLYAVPQEIRSINITMGYPLSGTSVAGLMDILADLQKHIRRSEGTIQFYYRNVLSLLANRYLQLSGQVEVNRLADTIRKCNKVFVSQSELAVTDLLRHIFVPVERPVECCDYLLRLLLLLQEELNRLDSADDNPEEKSVESVSV